VTCVQETMVGPFVKKILPTLKLPCVCVCVWGGGGGSDALPYFAQRGGLC